ncbi:magnesium-translocating P-type ATPase, partial [Candidatus Gottesmanbacteria bacterium RBG_13_45_10]
MVVVTTGALTELGKVAQSLVAKRPKTEFERGILSYGYLLMKMTFIITPVIFIIHVGLQHNVFSSLLFVLALIVGFAPELLPVILTINLAKGAQRMSKKGVIVKDLPAIENYGSMDVLCTDKTGTLTENSIELISYEDVNRKKNENVFSMSYLTSYFERGLENPLERAILKRGKPALAHAYKKVFELPFDFYRKRMSVIVEHNRKRMLITKGAPEKILFHALHYKEGEAVHPLTREVREAIHKRFEALSASGFRVLALAYRDIGKEGKYKTTDEHDLIFMGLLVFVDPPKKSAKAALQILENRGITVKILTGDNELVTAHACKELGIPIEGTVRGRDIERLDDPALARVVNKTTIFARLNPETKKRIIAALRKSGHVVGYLGDGVNDAPSLRASDIGISVNNAVDVAKESADLILLHKDLHVLLDGVDEGRKTFSNVMKYIMMGTSSNFGNMMSVALASLFLPFLPMLPVQILFNDLLYDVSQLLLGNDAVDESAIVKPKKWNMHFVRKFMLVFGPISSVFDCITFLVLLGLFHATPMLFQTGWFLESIATQTLI